MFEKNAEEYGNIFEWTNDDRIIDYSKQGFQKGAEFGYNKAKEDADKMKSRFLELCNLKNIRIDELEKANEWHYVKYGDLPSDYEIVFDQNNNKVYYVSKLKLWMYEGSSNIAEVEKWKEIE